MVGRYDFKKSPSQALSGRRKWEAGNKGVANLAAVPFKSVQDILVCGLGEAAGFSGLLIFVVSLAQPLGAIVEAVTKRLVGTHETVSPGHEDPLKGRGARTGVRKHEDGLAIRHIDDSLVSLVE
jgi:hypothetical protein